MDGMPDFTPLCVVLREQIDEGFHDGAQVYVSRHGEVLLDEAIGESRPGRPLRTDDLMLWYSSGKPLTAVAVAQLWERGHLRLDDPIARFVPGWGAGKERATVRHVLTHTGGFRMLGRADPFDTTLPYAEIVARIAAHPAEWEPGTQAGYHPTTGWKILGAVVEAVDGRPVDRYLAEEVLGPAGCTDARLGIAPADQARLGERIVPVAWKGHAVAVPTPMPSGGMGIRMAEYHIEDLHNEPAFIAKVEPGGGMRGPAHDLGRFYESVLGFGGKLLEPVTAECLGAVHRYALTDRTFGGKAPWGLGVQVAGSMGGRFGRRAFGHGGMASSRGFCDPDAGLVAVLVANGLPDPVRAEQRVVRFAAAVYDAFGDELAHLRTA